MPEDRLRKETERHQITMLNRQYAEMTGIVNVESFDVREFVLHTVRGTLSVRGENLHIKTLNLENGIVAIEGMIFDLSYFDEAARPAQKAKGWLGKLLR